MEFNINKSRALMLHRASFFLYLFVLDRILRKIALRGWINFFPNNNIAFGIPCPNFILYPLLIFIFYFVVSSLISAYQKENAGEFFAFALIFFGALSNVLDRINYSFIVDYLNFFSWSTVNLADLMISTGIIILIGQKIFGLRLIK